MAKDYYQILGIARTADADEIKKAYRRLAKQYHPDVNKGESGAEDRFKEVSEAYEVLSDAKKRKQYDMLGHAFAGGGAAPGGYSGFGGRSGGFSWSSGGGMPGQDVPDEMFEGGIGDLFSELFGMGGVRSRKGSRASTGTGRSGSDPSARTKEIRGQDLRGSVDIDFLEAVHGTTCQVELDRGATGKTEKISVKIPAGVTQGQQLRLSGKGGMAPAGGKAGDLFLEVRIRAHEKFWREGADVFTELPITFYEAILGGTVEVTTPDGSANMKLPAGATSGQKFRLRGKGAPIMGEKGGVGDLYAIIQIVPPIEIDEETRKIAENWSKDHPYNPRA